MTNTATQPAASAPPLEPNLPCPNCKANLLTAGFFNYCEETRSLREDNTAYIRGNRIYVDHEEDEGETIRHECALEARCQGCEAILPWTLRDLRELDGETLADAEAMIVRLIVIASSKTTNAVENASESAIPSN